MNGLDVKVENLGTIWTFEPLSEEAKVVFAEKVQSDPWQWMGPRLAVDHRMAHALADALEANEGLVLG